ncbi:MAG: FKBP-type peptidyl-prolyl cis-trans isomerase [Lachnospiraceae bacterium]|nr:FKBP-type peptidyl-prolyl cis-trans isomerase [Lachnospiraceae bacterium]
MADNRKEEKTAEVKKSKGKRREEEIRREKLQKTIVAIVGIVVGLIVAGCIAWVVIYSVSFQVKETDDYSIGLDESGLISGVKAKDYVTLCDYNNITVPYEEVSVSDEELDSYIDSLLSGYKTYSEDADRTVKMGDEINIDYVGSIGGVEFEGGSTQGGGTDIVVGQAGYIDDFEDQLVGHKAGENFDIEVTFPDDYGNDEVAGKDAVFNITVNGIYDTQEFNDEFVKANLSDQAQTADAFIENYKKEQSEQKLKDYIQNYVEENSTVNSYPDKYVKNLMKLCKGSAIQQYNSYNDYYQQSYGQPMYSSFEDYIGMDKKEYYASLRTEAEEVADKTLIYQAIFEDAGLSVTNDSKNALMEEYGIPEDYYTELETTYGKGYLNQEALRVAVLDYIKEHVTVEGQPE